MAVLLFRLRNVPEEEADDVRQILDQAGMAFYETSAGRWGIGMPAIWLQHDDDKPRARQLLDDYQHQRVQQMRAQQAELGEPRSLLQHWLAQPLRVIVYLAVVAVILYFSVLPFFSIFSG